MLVYIFLFVLTLFILVFYIFSIEVVQLFSD